ncbi:MAG: deoxyribose-phosphate aldolase [Clostridiales bacterium]|nr:deoxyribose-phosphate aldolase [Clostridiales bacterium]
MDVKEILSKCDYTLLDRSATFADIQAVLDDGIKYGVASVCIPPCFVCRAKQYVEDKLKICTVIGFPNGYNSTEAKLFEATEALNNGADEIDAVINVGELKAKNYDFILGEISCLKARCKDKILKIIIETCLLSDEEKIKMCELVYNGGADYIKTSTGFSSGGATREDIALMRKHLNNNVKIKASGGIRTIRDAEDFIVLGADRIGTSGIIKAVKALNL